jgi:hypothetical protein
MIIGRNSYFPGKNVVWAEAEEMLRDFKDLSVLIVGHATVFDVMFCGMSASGSPVLQNAQNEMPIFRISCGRAAGVPMAGCVG